MSSLRPLPLHIYKNNEKSHQNFKRTGLLDLAIPNSYEGFEANVRKAIKIFEQLGLIVKYKKSKQ